VADEPARTRRPPRFSLLALFLLTTILALTVIVLLLWREVVPLRAQVTRLEADLGHLHVTDEERPHVIAVRTDEPLTWRWRVYLPPLLHGKYHFNFFEGSHVSFTSENLTALLDQLRRGSPNHEFFSNSAVALSGELTIEAKLVDRDGHWFLQVPPFGEKRITIPDMWKELGLPDGWAAGEVVDNASEFAGLNTEREMVFGRGDAVSLLILQGPPVPFFDSRPAKGPLEPPLSTLMLWIDNTP
jgi:hypothetical protein